MDITLVQDNLQDIAIVSGVSVAILVSLFAIYKKFTKPTVRGARKSLKRLVRFLNSLDSADNVGKGTETYTLADVSLLIVDRDILWKGKRK